MTLQEIAALALALPEVTETLRWGNLTWQVSGKGFAWERPLSKADIKRYGDERPPEGPIAAVRVADLHEREALLAEGLAGVFTIEHFSGYPAVLLRLPAVHKRVARRLVEEAWLACAPGPVAAEYLAARRTP
jgi:hypothetical protein